MEEVINNIEAKTLDLIKESIPFLVKGKLASSGKDIIGFPYVYSFIGDDGKVKYCNCIIKPCVDVGKLNAEDKYAIAFKENEFFPVAGKIYRFSELNEEGQLIFEDYNLDEDARAEAMKSAEMIKGDSALQNMVRSLIIASFMNGVHWGAKHGVTENNIKK